MARRCACAGGCGPQEDPENGVTRREFVALLGVGTVGALLAPALTEETFASTRADRAGLADDPPETPSLSAMTAILLVVVSVTFATLVLLARVFLSRA